MQLMDRLIVNDSVAKVIDLGYPRLRRILQNDRRDRLHAKEAARRGVAPIVFLFMADSDRASLRGYEMLQQQFTRNSLYRDRQRTRAARRNARWRWRVGGYRRCRCS
jgi:hypothetical protein